MSTLGNFRRRWDRAPLLAGALLLTAMLATAPAGAGPPQPLVRIADLRPLTFAGLRFKPQERVVLRVAVAGERHVRKVRAASNGRFRVALGVSFDRCAQSLSVTAVGSRGSRVSWKLVPLDCPTAGGADR